MLDIVNLSDEDESGDDLKFEVLKASSRGEQLPLKKLATASLEKIPNFQNAVSPRPNLSSSSLLPSRGSDLVVESHLSGDETSSTQVLEDDSLTLEREPGVETSCRSIPAVGQLQEPPQKKKKKRSHTAQDVDASSPSHPARKVNKKRGKLSVEEKEAREREKAFIKAQREKEAHEKKLSKAKDAQERKLAKTTKTETARKRREEEKHKRQEEKEKTLKERGKYSLNEIRAVIDSRLLEQSLGRDILNAIDEHNNQAPKQEKRIQHLVRLLPVKNCVCWRYCKDQQQAGSLEHASAAGEDVGDQNQLVGQDAGLVVVCWKGEDLLDRIVADGFESSVRRLHENVTDWVSGARLVILVLQLNATAKKFRAEFQKAVCAATSAVDPAREASIMRRGSICERLDEELAGRLAWALIELGVSFMRCEHQHEAAEYICGMTRTLAEAPYSAPLSKFNTVDTTSRAASLANLLVAPTEAQIREHTWKDMLMKIPRVAEKDADAIAERFPTMSSLMSAYDQARQAGHTEADLEYMLADLLVRPAGKGANPDDNRLRRFGESKSWMVYHVFNCRDPNKLLQEKGKCLYQATRTKNKKKGKAAVQHQNSSDDDA